MQELLGSSGLGIALALGSMLLFAACVLGTAIGARGLDSSTGALLATLANVPVGLGLLVLQFLGSGAPRPPTLLGVAGFLVAGVFSTYLGRWLFFRSVEMLGPARASSFQSASPLFTALMGWLLLGETFGAIALVGLAVGIAGLLAMSRGAQRAGAGQASSPSSSSTATRGLLALGVGSAAAYAASHVMRAAAIREWNEPLAGATLGALAGLFVMALASRRQLGAMASRAAASPRSAWTYALVGALQVCAQTLMIASMRHIPASYAALISMGSPLVVLPVSYYVLRTDRGLTRLTLAGMLLTIFGVALLTVH